MSRFEFKLPDIGEGVTEGEIVSWLVQDGDSVSENQDMVEVMTDKATVTIGAPKTGTIVERRGKEGDVVPVGQVLVVLEVGGAGAEAEAPKRAEPKAEPKAEKPAQAPAKERAASKPAARAEAAESAATTEREPARAPAAAKRAEKGEDEGEEEEDAAEGEQGASDDDGPAATAVGDIKEVLPGMSLARSQKPTITEASDNGNGTYSSERPLAAPATRKLARELGVDLRRVRPTGPGGRVTREDVEGYQVQLKAPARAPAAKGTHDAVTVRPEGTAPAPPARPAPIASEPADERVPIRGVRKRIFENMARSKHTAAHFTYVDECDATALRGLRDRVKPYAERAGVKISFLPFILKATVMALKKHPTLNCLVDDAANEMVLRKTYDIGVAAATEAGLMVPVVRNADRLSILGIAQEIDRLGQSARDGKVKKEDLGGSSFTITSLGKLGGLFATPIVNYPEVAILGVHEIKRRPVVKDDQIVIGDVMLLSLSFDHRIIDGHVGAAFAQEIIGYLEEPDRLLVELA
jgi:pyruvate dehydrogenase E2 component (dihydrolipoamide acetyltransferase)